MWKVTLTAWLGFCLTWSNCVSSAGAEEIAFPKLDTQAFCTEGVSRMLNPVEKMLELMKCLAQEAKSLSQAEPYWSTLNEKQKKECLRPFTEPKFSSYLYLQYCMATSVGLKCMAGELNCGPEK